MIYRLVIPDRVFAGRWTSDIGAELRVRAHEAIRLRHHYWRIHDWCVARVGNLRRMDAARVKAGYEARHEEECRELELEGLHFGQLSCEWGETHVRTMRQLREGGWVHVEEHRDRSGT